MSGGNITSGAPYTFSFTLSKPIPSTFDVPAPYDAIGWEFCIDTDPSTEPSGYPFAASTAMPCEFIVMEISQGGNHGGHVAKVTGTLIDRRPLLDGKKATTSSIPRTMDVQLSSSSFLGFSVFKNGAEVLVQVPARSIGRPRSFEWVLFTTELTLPLGSDDFTNMDEAPDGNFASPAGGFTW